MADLLLDIANFWISESLVTTVGTDIFLDILPDSPDNCVVIVEYAGETSFINNALNRSIQVRVRNTVRATAKSKIIALYDSVYDPEAEVRIIDFTAARWGIVSPRQYPYSLTRDENKRFIFVFNMGIVAIGDS